MRLECMKYQTKLLNVSASVEKDNRVKFTCALATDTGNKLEVKIAKVAVLPTGDIVISYTTKPAQEVEIRFNNLEALETLHYILETIRTFNPKNRVRDISIWKLNINLSTIEFDYIEETKIIIQICRILIDSSGTSSIIVKWISSFDLNDKQIFISITTNPLPPP